MEAETKCIPDEGAHDGAGGTVLDGGIGHIPVLLWVGLDYMDNRRETAFLQRDPVRELIIP
jgi:hypothetical protein